MAPGTLLAGRTALVTGGAGPLGSQLSDALATAGARVVIADIDADRVAETVANLPADTGIEHVGATVNLLDFDAVNALVEKVTEIGACDILVNNAALTGTSGVTGFAVPFEQQTDAAFELALRLNLTVPFSLSRRLLPLLRRSGHGSIINVCSIYGLVGPNMGLYQGTVMGNPAAYGASKGGLAQLTRYLATVLAPEVRCNAFAPGGIARGQAESFVARYEALTPLGRMAAERDFRGIVTWLAGDESAFVTGQVIAVDGGWTAW
jgi:NAD(P)-dependent dehydrogenase (short-subunit alcohol dehydrogenase family)